MAVTVVIEVNSGSSSVILDVVYRWYCPGEDPWTCRDPTQFGATSGTWYSVDSQGVDPNTLNRTFGSAIFRGRTPISSNGLVLYMPDLGTTEASGNPFRVGMTGTAHHNVRGGTIPLGDVQWTVRSIN